MGFITGEDMNRTNPEEIQRLFENSPFIADLGLQLDRAGDGECCTQLTLETRHLQQDGYVHAGVLATMADHTAGAAGVTLIAKNQYVLTAEFRMSLLRAARGSRLICKARVLKAGRMLSVVESEVLCCNADTSILATKATVTLAIVEKP